MGSWRSWHDAFVERMTDDLLNNEIIFLTHDTFFPSSETDNPPSPPLSHPLHGFSVWFLCGFYCCSRFATIKKINVIPSLQSTLFSYSWTVMWWYEIKCSAQILSPQTCKVVLIFLSVPCMSFNLYILPMLREICYFFCLSFLNSFFFPHFCFLHPVSADEMATAWCSGREPSE